CSGLVYVAAYAFFFSSIRRHTMFSRAWSSDVCSSDLVPALAFNFVVIVGTALAVLVSYDQVGRMEMDHPEYYPLVLLSALGAMVMAAAGDLVTLLLGLEVLSLPVYVLSAWRTGARQSEEAGMKYFLLGAFGSAILVYGAALL